MDEFEPLGDPVEYPDGAYSQAWSDGSVVYYDADGTPYITYPEETDTGGSSGAASNAPTFSVNPGDVVKIVAAGVEQYFRYQRNAAGRYVPVGPPMTAAQLAAYRAQQSQGWSKYIVPGALILGLVLFSS